MTQDRSSAITDWMGSTPTEQSSPTTSLLSLIWDGSSNTFQFSASIWIIGIALLAGFVGVIWKLKTGDFSWRNFEIDQADIGIGDQKLTFRPNMTDRQVAYAIWVELSTRKIGLPIEFDDDVISEIYDSWHGFFSVTRELVKGIPAQKVGRDSTQKIIRLSIEVLNEGLRPHLTKWQARFRHWYDRELRKYDEGDGVEVLDPQMIQEKFPQYEALKSDMERVNHSLMKYREKMLKLILKD
ncbi:MAG: hypothetical protein WA940_08455 [Sphingopyxis sp.]